MADRATAAGVAADMQPPNYRSAVQRLRGIVAKKAKIAGVNGEIADVYAKVEGYRVNKKAARIFLTLDALEADDRDDVTRSLMGLMECADWDRGGDLVDDAEGGNGNVVKPVFGRAPKPVEGENAAGEDQTVANEMDQVDGMGGEGEGEDGEETVEEPVAETAVQRRTRLAKANVREHFDRGRAPPPTGTQEVEPYTGDNSDLAGND